MGTTFRPYQPDQMLLLPQDLREWVPEGHLAHHVSDLVDALDLGAFYAPYKGDGRRNSPYDPRMMVKVLIYAYGTGTFSSRKMAGKLEEDIAFRMLAAGNFPRGARPIRVDQHLHHHPRIVGRVAPPVPFVRRVERPEIQGVHQVAHMVRQVPFRNPLPKILRQ